MADCTHRSVTGLVDWRALVHQAQMSATPQPVEPVKKLFTAAGAASGYITFRHPNLPFHFVWSISCP